MDLDITFGDRTMRTPIYIKMDAQEQLLLSEGVSSRLGLVTYHPEVLSGGVEMRPPPVIDDANAEVPMVSVHLVCTTSLLPYRSTIARVKVPDGCPKSQRFLLEANETIGTKLGL